MEVTCRRCIGVCHVMYPCALRAPNGGSALSSAAYRAFNSLNKGANGLEYWEEYGPSM